MNDETETITLSIDAGTLLLIKAAYEIGRELPKGDDPIDVADVLSLAVERIKARP
jgi:hypothetical protein